MGKKLLTLFILFLVILINTGCNKLDMSLEVHKDGTADTKFVIAGMDNPPANSFTADLVLAFQKAGYMVYGNSRDGYTFIGKGALQFKKILSSLPELPGIPEIDSLYGYRCEKSFWFTTYALDWDVPLEPISQGPLAKISGVPEICFKVILPVKPISHNAMGVSQDGKTLTWILIENGPQEVHFYARRLNWELILLSAGGVGLLALVLVSKLLRLVRTLRELSKRF